LLEPTHTLLPLSVQYSLYDGRDDTATCSGCQFRFGGNLGQEIGANQVC
jgi:hypothetical protein